MQLVKFKSSLLIAVLMTAGISHALVKDPAAATATVSTNDSQGRQLVDLSKGPISEPAKEIKIGTASAGKQEEGTLRQVFKLQREAYIAEMKNKIKTPDDSSKAAAAASQANPSLTMPPMLPMLAGSSNALLANAIGPGFPQFTPLPTPPSELLPTVSNIFIHGSKARAEVFFDGQMRSIKVGDNFGGWTVSSIEPGVVNITKQELTYQDSVLAPQNAMIEVSNSKRYKNRKPTNFTRTEKIAVEKLVTKKLLPYKADMSASTVANLPHITVPGLPPIKTMNPPTKYPDSTAFNPMPSLPNQTAPSMQ